MALARIAALLVLGCAAHASAQARDAGLGDAAPSTPWARAESAWRLRDAHAYDLWLEVPGDTPEGAAARARLAEADALYREGIAPLDRSVLAEASAIAPIDPDLYVPLAEAFRAEGTEDGDERAKFFLLRYLTARPRGARLREACRALLTIEPDLSDIVRSTCEPPPTHLVFPAPPPQLQTSPVPPAVWIAVGAAGGLAFAAILAWLSALARRGPSLERLSRTAPEMHPAIAYLVGVLRHELLKHRIGAVADAVAALAGGKASEAQRAFLRTRLFGGEPIEQAWEGHVMAFERALGPRVDLRGGDEGFRRAARAIEVIARLEPRLAAPDPRTRRRLAEAHATLRAFDDDLARLAARLVRTTIDSELLEQAVREVRAEYSAGLVELAELRVDAVATPVVVEVFRVDLVLVLKNLVRNAVLAVGRADPPRRIAISVETDVEPTGEEIVRILVRDSSPEMLTTDTIRDRPMDRGLGLVTSALRRYDGSIEVTPGGDGFAKTVTIRLFAAS